MRSRNEEICINKPNNFLMRMKIKTFMFAALAAFATLAGCSDDENKTPVAVAITEREEILSRANIR